MPEYLFRKEGTEDITTSFFYKMTEAPALGSKIIDQDGIIWIRIVSLDINLGKGTSESTKVDPYSEKQFKDRFEGKKVTLGDMMDASKELSEKRAAKEGKDPVKQKFYDKYAEERKGTRHPKEVKENFEVSKKEVEKEISKKLNSS